MKKNTLKLVAAIPATGLNRRNFIKTACVAATAVATTQLAAQEQTQRATPARASAESVPGNTLQCKDSFKPGDKVPASGIYDVIHDRLDGDDHALPHQITAIADTLFPPCRVCREWVDFRLHRAAEHVEAHHLFGV